MSKFPASLLKDLLSCNVPELHVEDICFEATARMPWVVSLDRDQTHKPAPYATVRPGDFRCFDSLDAAILDAGGLDAPESNGRYYELVNAEIRDRDVSFSPPLTFQGEIGNIMIVAYPRELLAAMNQAQAAQLRGIMNRGLEEATKAGKIKKNEVIQPLLIPDGVKFFRLVEKKSDAS